MKRSLSAENVSPDAGFQGADAEGCLGTSTGRKCDGYDLSLVSLGSQPTIPSPPGQVLARTESESRSFQFFREQTLSQLTFSFSEELWEKAIFQIAEVEPCIRHALFALSGFHENALRVCGGRGEEQPSFALGQYNLAIRELLKFQDSQDQTTSILHLVSCVIFISIEIIRGQYDTVIQLYKYGRRVVAEYKEKQPSHDSSADLFSRIEALFARLDIQMIQLLDDQETLLAVTSGWDLQSSLLPVPTEFHSLSEAREALERFACSYFGALSLFSEDAHIIDTYVEYLEQWSKALDAFKNRYKQSFTPSQRRGLAILRLHQKECELSLLLRKSLVNGRKPWERSTEYFDKMLDYAEIGAGWDNPKDDNDRVYKAPLFCLDIGFVSVLYFIVARCRVDRVRQRALRILRQSNRQEGVWNAKLISYVAERVIQLEKDVFSGDSSVRDGVTGKLAMAVDFYFQPGETCNVLRFKVGVMGWQNEPSCVWLHSEKLPVLVD